jgi:hypothetical protein
MNWITSILLTGAYGPFLTIPMHCGSYCFIIPHPCIKIILILDVDFTLRLCVDIYRTTIAFLDPLKPMCRVCM